MQPTPQPLWNPGLVLLQLQMPDTDSGNNASAENSDVGTTTITTSSHFTSLHCIAEVEDAAGPSPITTALMPSLVAAGFLLSPPGAADINPANLTPPESPASLLGRAAAAAGAAAAAVNASSGGASTEPRRCSNPLPSSPPAHLVIAPLLDRMSRQLPDEVDHPLLLGLARACLCEAHLLGNAVAPGGEDGGEDSDAGTVGMAERRRRRRRRRSTSRPAENNHLDADAAAALAIYRWTGLLSAEAARLRLRAELDTSPRNRALPDNHGEGVRSPPQDTALRWQAGSPDPAVGVAASSSPRLLARRRHRRHSSLGGRRPLPAGLGIVMVDPAAAATEETAAAAAAAAAPPALVPDDEPTPRTTPPGDLPTPRPMRLVRRAGGGHDDGGPPQTARRVVARPVARSWLPRRPSPASPVALLPRLVMPDEAAAGTPATARMARAGEDDDAPSPAASDGSQSSEESAEANEEADSPVSNCSSCSSLSAGSQTKGKALERAGLTQQQQQQQQADENTRPATPASSREAIVEPAPSAPSTTCCNTTRSSSPPPTAPPPPATAAAAAAKKFALLPSLDTALVRAAASTCTSAVTFSASASTTVSPLDEALRLAVPGLGHPSSSTTAAAAAAAVAGSGAGAQPARTRVLVVGVTMALTLPPAAVVVAAVLALLVTAAWKVGGKVIAGLLC